MAAILRYGDHAAMTTTALGRFGVGIKAQAINAGDEIHVHSTSKDVSVKLWANLRDVLKSGRWKVPLPRWLPYVVGSPTGTTITISGLRAVKAPRDGWQRKIIGELAEMFYPALEEGRKIIVNDEQVPLLAEPRMSEVIDQHLPLSDGRSAHLRAGILTEPSRLNRVHVGSTRIIMPASITGCTGYSGSTKMFARVQLSGPWHLAKFKNGLTDDDEKDDSRRPSAKRCDPF